MPFYRENFFFLFFKFFLSIIHLKITICNFKSASLFFIVRTTKKKVKNAFVLLFRNIYICNCLWPFSQNKPLFSVIFCNGYHHFVSESKELEICCFKIQCFKSNPHYRIISYVNYKRTEVFPLLYAFFFLSLFSCYCCWCLLFFIYSLSTNHFFFSSPFLLLF